MLWKPKKKEAVDRKVPSFFLKALIQLNDKLIWSAAYLQGKSSCLPPRRLKLLLGLFCLLFLSSSAYLIISALKEKALPFRITSIQAIPLAPQPLQQPTITDKDFLRLRRLRLSLDSLAKTPSGKVRLDSLLQRHPKLLDTLALLENIYYEQHKKRHMNVQLTNLQRKRKALLILPLLVIPFFTMAFWATGGGKGENSTAKANSDGLNLQLPSAQLGDDRDKTKLSFYESQKKEDTPVSDSTVDFSFRQDKNVPDASLTIAEKARHVYDPTPPNSISVKDPNEAKVYQKLAELNGALKAQASTTKKVNGIGLQSRKEIVATEDVERLAGMMQNAQSKNEPDPELAQLNGMMERILDIQHPERVKEKLKEQSAQNKKGVYPVSPYKMEVKASLLGSVDRNGDTNQHNTFLDEKSQHTDEAKDANAVMAAIGEDGAVSSGSTIKLRLLTDVYVGGVLISKGTFVFGTAALSENRLKVSIPSIRYKENLYPVSLNVYDLDGLEGIGVPGLISRDVAKGTAEQSLQSVGLLTLDPSLKAQATAAGVQAAKGLLSKNVKLVKVTLKTGYQVLLKDENQQQ
ncbi:conjugative transposon protein TraM [Flavisolibacter nicotianae]|uniref:conjugative transposon protein TraM n=1 Tax=Flavisolibacter nicotianae TaxID=2364882 RepID=UPI000EB141EE|nr:conjugative transposon protein TraM [Flavisolibacter nicotianae]